MDGNAHHVTPAPLFWRAYVNRYTHHVVPTQPPCAFLKYYIFGNTNGLGPIRESPLHFYSTFEDNKHVQLHSRNLLCCLHLHLPTKSSEFRKERDGKDNTFQRVLCHPEFGLDVLILLKSERSFLHILVLNWFEEARLRASNF